MPNSNLDTLIATNVAWLRQAEELLRTLTDEVYGTTPVGMAPHRAGGHLRHILEFYESFLNGLDSGVVDYDARKRDGSVERSCWAASTRIQTTIHRLASVSCDALLEIRMEDAPEGLRDCLLPSSVVRELQVLSSHTIHHFALLAMTLRGHGVVVDPSFGMAPSTLRYEALKQMRAHGEAA
jgi:hypothetical protein